jgi:hypothetical protein
MARAPIASVAIVLATVFMSLETSPVHAAEQPRAAATDSQPSPEYDAAAERQLLDMANRDRAKAGLPPLQKMMASPRRRAHMMRPWQLSKNFRISFQESPT